MLARKIQWMLPAFAQVTPWAKKLDVAPRVIAAECQRHNVVSVVFSANVSAAFSTFTTLHAQDAAQIGSSEVIVARSFSKSADCLCRLLYFWRSGSEFRKARKSISGVPVATYGPIFSGPKFASCFSLLRILLPVNDAFLGVCRKPRGLPFSLFPSFLGLLGLDLFGGKRDALRRWFVCVPVRPGSSLNLFSFRGVASSIVNALGFSADAHVVQRV